LIHVMSLIIPFAILLPNLFFFVIPPRNMPAEGGESARPILKLSEGIGRLGVFVLPLFSTIHSDNPYEVVFLLAMFVFLAIYGAGWLRYYVRGRGYELLFSPMYGMPVPLAISPILYFISASVVLHSPLLFLSSLLLALGHIPLSLDTYHHNNHRT